MARLFAFGAFAATLGESACPSSPTWLKKGELVQRNITSSGVNRDYLYYVPTTYDASKALPLVYDFHGFYGEAKEQADEDGMKSIAESQGFIVVYPDGSNDATHEPPSPDRPKGWLGSWNIPYNAGKYGRVCSTDHEHYPCYASCVAQGVCKKGTASPTDCHTGSCVDDLAFMEAVHKEVTSVMCVDEQRVHGTGISNGAIFLYYLTTQEFGRNFASIVPVAGNFFLGHSAGPTHPVAIMEIHGEVDHFVPANSSNSFNASKDNCPVTSAGKEGCAVSIDGWYYAPMQTVLRQWASSNGCTDSTNYKRTATLTKADSGAASYGFWCRELTEANGCSKKVRQCTHTGGHNWPFHVAHRSWPSNDNGLLFAEVAWQFMSEQTLSSNVIV
jgi:polyhydroxybutyrate depolymerase